MLTPEVISAAFKQLGTVNRIYIAYSGGVDSHVLLDLCAGIPEFYPRLVAVYVHHGLQPLAEAWAVHCEQISKQLGVGFVCLRVNAQAETGVSPEAAARDARYQALANLLASDDVLLLAQHQDDQLETVLLQLFRGAGLQGLAGMPTVAPLGRGRSIRPLLNVAKQDILAYAQQQQLAWVEDPTNQCNAFDRNLLRNEVLPLLTQRWPMLAVTVARSARHCANAQSALQAQSSLILAEVLDSTTQAIDLVKLNGYSAFQQRLVVRYWLQGQDLKMPSEAVLSAVFEQVIAAEQTRNPELIYQQRRIKRYRQHLYCIPVDPVIVQNLPAPLLWPAGKPFLAINQHSQLRFVAAANGIHQDYWCAGDITVRFRSGGEKIALKGRTGRQSLKKLYQEAAIPPWQRAHMPLLYINGELAAIADRWISSKFWTEDSAKAMRLVWDYTEVFEAEEEE